MSETKKSTSLERSFELMLARKDSPAYIGELTEREKEIAMHAFCTGILFKSVSGDIMKKKLGALNSLSIDTLIELESCEFLIKRGCNLEGDKQPKDESIDKG